MRKIIDISLLLFMSILMIWLVGCQNNVDTATVTNKQKGAYVTSISNFIPISPQEIETVSNSTADVIYIYFGRVTCLECREFVNALKKAAEKNEKKIYYVDTENTDTDEELKAARKTFKVNYVPTLIKLSSLTTDYVRFNEQKNSLDYFFSE